MKLLSIGNHSNTLVTGCSKDARTHEKEEGGDFEIYGREGNQFGRLQGNYIRVMILSLCRSTAKFDCQLFASLKLQQKMLF